MTARAVVIGLLLALLISVGTYFNDWVIGQTQLIGNHLPISVFGVAALLLLGVSPLLERVRAGAGFRAGEVAVITALGLLSCGWPGSNFFRTFTHMAALPSHWIKTRPSWQSTHVMSYVPGASAELGQGHVRDWDALARRLREHEREHTPSARVWALLDASGQRVLDESASAPLEQNQIAMLTRALDTTLARADFYRAEDFRGVSLPAQAAAWLARPAGSLAPHELTARNRWLLVAAFPDLVLPAPSGSGVLFDGGRADPFAVDTLLQGRGKAQLSLGALPWSKWWPTLRLWVGAALALSLAALCLGFIVHPQWAKRELLPYPIARFVEELGERKPASLLPEIARSKLFWLGFVSLLCLHLLNGLHAWFDWVPELPRKYDFWPLAGAFPNANRVWGSWGYFGPTFYLSVVAFAFFMSTSVSFSLGISHVLFMAFGALLFARGLQLDSGNLDAKGANLLRFGSYLGVALAIAYTGRSYYARVAASVVGVKSAEAPARVAWAARGLTLAVLVAIAVVASAGLSLPLATLFVLLELLIFVVMTRIVCETGAFFIQTGWSPVGVVTALCGFQAIGPSALITLSIATTMLFNDSRELLMPFVANALKLSDRTDGPTPSKLMPWFLLVLLGGCAIAGATTLLLQYNHSVTQVGNDWARDYLPTFPFESLSQAITSAAADGSLSRATATHGLGSLSLLKADQGAWIWLGLGLSFALISALARLRLPWWPLHPVAFLVWGTYPIAVFGPSFLVGWMVKASVMRLTGARGYRLVRPLMIGVIAGELLAGLFWMTLGAGYYFLTGKAPVAYNIFPG